MTDKHAIAARCPQCGHGFSHAGSLDGADTPQPEEGDFSVCIRCGAILQFDAAGALGPTTPEEWAKLELVQPGEATALLTYQRKVRLVAESLRHAPSRGSA